jgi:hypothetical protein
VPVEACAPNQLPPYLVLLRVGFALPAPLLERRCALTAPFHPYPAVPLRPRSIWRRLSGTAGRYVFCGTCRQPTLKSASRTLSGTLLCGVRTFLPHFLTKRERPSGPAAYVVIILDESKNLGIRVGISTRRSGPSPNPAVSVSRSRRHL